MLSIENEKTRESTLVINLVVFYSFQHSHQINNIKSSSRPPSPSISYAEGMSIVEEFH